MNSSTLPPLLKTYLPQYEVNREVKDSCVEHPVPISDQFEAMNCHEVKKSKNRREKYRRDSIEDEERNTTDVNKKAFNMLKMWNIVKDQERKRKQKTLHDRVRLQHEMIKKQDELILEKNTQEKKENKKTVLPKSQKKKYSKRNHLKRDELYPGKNSTALKKNNVKTFKVTVVEEKPKEEPPMLLMEEKLSEVSSRVDVISEDNLSDFLERSAIEDADFHELRVQPLPVQLQRLFGNDADGFLNPSVKEKPRKQFDLSIARQSHEGAAALWDALRAYSRQKLLNKDALILPDVKNAYACFIRECLRRHITPVKRNFVSEEEAPEITSLEESEMLKDVRYRRHRQDLMYRIAHVNKDKTKLLLQVTAEPHYTKNIDDDGIRRYYPESETENEELSSCMQKSKLPLIQINTSHEYIPKLPHRKQLPVAKGFSNLVFLTERKAKCKGEFSKRLHRVESDLHLKPVKPEILTSMVKSSSPMFTQRVWEPLSMQALIDMRDGVVRSQIVHSSKNTDSL
ncbi:uncharacterized protein LOC124434880 isoform X2 [Xenia sp. Carnegie-2017]|uniref:uncharacterized protein LOC124434880 isoform X2 n=1 Tax=Xenia sp. Carnegie-2017 TaxID=2897299 RepID=UPI001F03EA88|nr:uncharacterized protein LOC124434880 isoform X2 [Xenia sp. Carnegie-2017]